ncbi:efflux RND transporter periplasmic adaptor subunit [Kozakia baliensis]|uniref:efflux RND transporter periplasmic adaptor subunit n=1 Tax=Kozakia baliensis TaxID=153496 RepID=UPI0004984CEA|nr:efflux RND transporter periplasmic adaptor subunit [Kozakia baliensis]
MAKSKWLIAVFLLLAVILAGWGITARVQKKHALGQLANDATIPVVSFVTAKKEPQSEEVILPGSVAPAFNATIYARTNGYLKKWYVDIGDHVSKGQVLAEIDSPEIDQQLLQAKADLMAAEANNKIAQTLAHRTRALLPSSAVSQQSSDQAASDANARASTVASNQANVQRLEQLVSFEEIRAPYDGIVTTRNTDIGHLINSGSNNGPELFQIADISWLRIYVQVPQSYAASITPKVVAELHFPEYPGRAFVAHLVNTAHALQPENRTLLVQLRIDNQKGELFPGGYTEVHFKIPPVNPGISIPASALLFRAEGLQVATLTPDRHVKLHDITQGRDFGTDVEILKGLEPNEPVILNPPAALVDGQKVRVSSQNSHKRS